MQSNSRDSFFFPPRASPEFHYLSNEITKFNSLMLDCKIHGSLTKLLITNEMEIQRISPQTTEFSNEAHLRLQPDCFNEFEGFEGEETGEPLT
jgi:hypothetical protein